MANDIKTFQTEFIDCRKNIQIPLLQRDYVQGGRKDVIEPFLEKLISAIKEESIQVNLNYIYGYDKENWFVPIDGQQRLITLWLLHLYIYANKTADFSVKLKFESREFADNFCEQLSTNLCNILKEDIGNSLKEKIIDSSWFVSGWLYDATVNNMLSTLDLIHKKIGGANIDNAYTHNITFDFLNMKDRLDDDVYVKMNGRGRPLSYFENLKSWMDEHVKKEFGEDDEFTKNWRTKMDNEWTDLFWDNRNKKQGHPEEIDDEQQRFLYSMLLLFWKKHELDFLNSLEKDEERITKSNYILFLNEWGKEDNEKLSEDSAIEDIRKKTFSLLQDGEKLIPLYWIEKTKIFDKNVFHFVKEGLDSLNKNKDSINNKNCKSYNDIICAIYLDSEMSYLYQIAFKEATYKKTLPLLYAIIKTPDNYKNEKKFYQWLRLWKNLILNSNIESEDIGNSCYTIENISQKVDSNNLYEVVSNLKWERGFGFNENQFNEEIAKAKQILNGEPRSDGKSWEEIIIEAENYAFFKGAIRFLFQDAEGKVTEDSWKNFDTKWANAQKYFDENGVKTKYQNEAILLRCYIAEFKNWGEFWDYTFDNEPNTWKQLLISKRYKANHNVLINNKEGKYDFLKFEPSLETFTEGYKTLQESVQKELVATNILVNISESSVMLHWRYNNYCLYPYRTKSQRNIYVIANPRNVLLSKLIKKKIIISEQHLDDSDFFWGWDINFQYNNINFQWYRTDFIYLMKTDFKYLVKTDNTNKVIKNDNESEDLKKYYCFDATNISSSDEFLKQLDTLIQTFINDSNVLTSTDSTK